MADNSNAEKEPKIIHYVVLRKCQGFPPIGGSKKNRDGWRRQDVPDAYYSRLWEKDEKVSLSSDIKVPRHFHDLREPTPKAARAKRHAINSRKVRKISSSEQP